MILLRADNVDTGHSDFAMPVPALNRPLTRVFASEAALLRVSGLPVGVSIVPVARVGRPLTLNE